LRIVSLVPSLTKSLFDLGCTCDEVVGRTPWCIHPAEQVSNVDVVGGTKTPNLGKIERSKPTLLVLDRDENPLEVYQWAQSKNIETFVCHLEHPRDVPSMLKELGSHIGKDEQADYYSNGIQKALESIPAIQIRPVVLPLIWHEPLMAVSPEKYAGGIIEAIGFKVPRLEEGGTGYPIVSAQQIVENQIEGLLLSSEPHEFALAEGEAICDEVERISGFRPWCECVNGEDLTWMGTTTMRAISSLYEALKHRLPTQQ
jgi:ABC-type Fe3+-hydroxamate transport system substrate-binding protein